MGINELGKKKDRKNKKQRKSRRIGSKAARAPHVRECAASPPETSTTRCEGSVDAKREKKTLGGEGAEEEEAKKRKTTRFEREGRKESRSSRSEKKEGREEKLDRSGRK